MKQEEKAKRYDEVLAMAKECLKDGTITSTATGYIETIFPELRESEDEKIRKEIACIIRTAYWTSNRDRFNKLVAWLEKQGESYTKRDVDDAYLEGFTSAKNEIEKQYEANYQIRKDIATFIFNYKGDIKDRAKWMDYLGIKASFVEKQSEQKPTNLAKGEDYGIDGLYNAIRILEETLGKVDGYQTDDGILEHECAISAVKKLYEQKPAWSEDDEVKMNRIVACLENLGVADYDILLKDVDWLNSLKDRVGCEVNCTTTKEWSEEDEKNFARVDYACLKVYGGDSYSSDWLRKFLGIHKKWKPSEEQMDALNDVIIYVKDSMFPSKNVLKKLYGQLKKLKEK